MRHNSHSSHDYANDLEAERDRLLDETKDFLKGGVVRDLAHALAADQSDHSPTIKVQVPKEAAGELAESLRGIIASPEAVHVTDITGKQIQLHPGVSYEDLAEMVCNKGYRLHVVPPIDAAAFAADIASSTDGRVIIPGRKHIVHNDLAEYLAATLEEGNQARMATVAKLLRTCGDGLVSKSGRAFADLAEGKEISADDPHAVEAQRLSELIVEWARFRTASSPDAFSEGEGPIVDGNRLVEISASEDASSRTRVFAGESRMIEIVADSAEQTHTSDEESTAVSDAEFEFYRTAKLRHAKAAMAAMDEAAPESDIQAYAQACADLAAADPESRVSNALSDDQHISLIKDLAEQSRQALRRHQQSDTPIKSGTDLRDILSM